MFQIFSNVLAVLAITVSLFALWYSQRATHAAERQAKASEKANAIAEKVAEIAKIQAESAEKANALAREMAHSGAILPLVNHFLDLTKDGLKFNDNYWTNRIWSLHALEFYFFHNGWIPKFLYRIWMVELGRMYKSPGIDVMGSHWTYLERYPEAYPEMRDFFKKLQDICNQPKSEPRDCDKAILKFVDEWEPNLS